MRAYKCNRCGKYYDDRQDSGPYITFRPKLSGVAEDLCLECEEELRQWWMAGEQWKKANESAESEEKET